MAKLQSTSKKTKGSTRARATRIDKDVKTTMRQSRVLSLLYDLMWSYRYFKYLALALLLADAVLGYLIIQYIPYTEIDWRAYMQQVEAFKAGERNYINIRGDTGPLVYPAGFLYVFSVLHTVTDAGTNIRRAQYIFLGFYLITIATMLAIYNRARVMPPWAVVFLCVSKRLHSIYMLRLFNDGVAMMLLWIAVYLFASQKWRMGCAVFSFAVSIKMNVLLFAPALFFLLLQSCGILRTAWYLFICASIQIILGLPFLRHNWFSYLHKAFELSRVFTFQWTVNWKFLPEDVFVSKELALGLLGAHILFLILFLQKHFNIIGTFRAVLYKPFAIYEPFPIRSEVIVTSMFVINFVGIAFARTLHYQFYSWFYPTLPYLLWKTNMPLLFRVKSLIIAEYAFNAFPATPASSTVLQLMNLFLIISLYFTDDQSNYVPYLDADARINLLSFINEECFDGARQFALYYGSVTEDLAEGAAVTSIDEREVVLSLPKLKLTLAVGFGSSAPVTSEGYGRQVLKVMLAEATEGIAAGETMGSLINKEYTEAQERETKSTHGMASLRRRGPGGIGDSPAVSNTNDLSWTSKSSKPAIASTKRAAVQSSMTVALAFESDDGSRAIQTTVEVAETDGVRAEHVDIRSYYEIERTVAQIRAGGFKNIAMQFPDSLLPDAPRVQQELKNGLENAYERIFILGDTSYGSCCVDEVAAQHLFADCIVHYGRTCLSATSKIPVVYVFGNAPIDVGHCVDVVASHIVDTIASEKAVVLLYEPSYNYAMAAIVTQLQERIGGERKLLPGDMTTFYDPSKASEEAPSSTSSVFIGGQEVKLNHSVEDADEELQTTITPEKFAIAYIGAESPHLTSILLRHSALDCYSYHPVEQQMRKEGASVNRALMRRYFLVQQAKEAQIYGILMGTLGVSKYLDVVHSLQKLIKKSGRKSYLFVVGKVNVPKLANYAEIDAFVLVACQQNTLMDSKEFYKPIVTPYELQLALSSTEEWTGEYKTDFREVLPAITKTAQELDDEANGEGGGDSDEDSDKPYFSLVTGTYKNSVRANSSSTATQSEANNSVLSTALQVKSERADLVEYRSEAGEFLVSREYRGLEPRIGETPAHAAVMGATGIARGYTHES